jgi:hypothetical protein
LGPGHGSLLRHGWSVPRRLGWSWLPPGATPHQAELPLTTTGSEPTPSPDHSN